MWVSGDLDTSNTRVMPFKYGVGDHCAFILDITIESLIGVDPVKIVRSVGRRLNSRLAGCCKAYIESFKANIARHRLLERLYNAHTGAHSNKDQATKIMMINEEGKTYMRRAEKICQKSSAVAYRFCRRPQSGYEDAKYIL